MGSVLLTIFIGVIFAIPLIYILELEGQGAITLLIFLSVGIVGIFLAIMKLILKRWRKPDANNSIKS